MVRLQIPNSAIPPSSLQRMVRPRCHGIVEGPTWIYCSPKYWHARPATASERRPPVDQTSRNPRRNPARIALNLDVRRMSDIRQLKLQRWERIKRGGVWRFVLRRGVLGWGLSFWILFSMLFFVSSQLFLVSREPLPFPWYLSLPLSLGCCLCGGFVWDSRCGLL